MYNKIKEFCKVKNEFGSYKDVYAPPNRVYYLMNLLDSLDIKYELDEFESESKFTWSFSRNYRPGKYYNIILKGTSNNMVVAHHDVVNVNVDNANDNSCSVINAIMTKVHRPDVNVVLLDGEEIGGIGSQRLSNQINAGDFGDIKWVLNLELTGKGGKSFFIGEYPGALTEKIRHLFDCPIYRTPFNDADVLSRNGIDSVVINPLPITNTVTPIINKKGQFLDMTMLRNCHTAKDTLDTISVDDMKEFVEEVILKLV